MYRDHPIDPILPDKGARRVISIYRTTGIEKPDLALFVSLDSIGQSVFIPRIAPSGHFSYKLSISIERDKTHAFFVQYKNKTVRYCEILRFRILAIGQLICVIQRDDLYFIKIIEKGGFLVSKRPDQFGKSMLFPAMVETYAIFALLISILALNGIGGM